MNDNLPAKYAKTVQLLQKKKDELEQVFEEARALETENTNLLSQNRELKSRNIELESATRSMSYEFATLEAQVKKQQAKLQHYIDLDATGHGSNRPRAQDAAKISALSNDVAELQKKNFHYEEVLRKADELQGRLQSQVEAATDELRELRGKAADATALNKSLEDKLHKAEQRSREATVKLDEATHQRAEYLRSTNALERVEMEALDGLRQEIMVLTEENGRLMDQLEGERGHLAELRSEAERFDDLVKKQRYLSEGQLKIARDEVTALNVQNESLLGEVKRLMADREQMRKKLQQPPATPHVDVNATLNASAIVPVASPTPKRVTVVEPLRVETRSIGTMTVEVFHAPMPSLEATTPVRVITGSPTPQKQPGTDALVAELRTSLESQRSATHRLEAAVEHLEVTNDGLQLENDGLRGLLREKESSVHLLEEKNRLLSTELNKAHQQVSQGSATPLERLLHRSPSQGQAYHSLLSELEDVDRAVAKTLVLGTRAFRTAESLEHALLDTMDTPTSSSDTDDILHTYRNRSQRGNAKEESLAVPVVPCDKFREPIVNHIMEQVGGLRHIVKRLWSVVKAQSNRAHTAKRSATPQHTVHTTYTHEVTAQHSSAAPPHRGDHDGRPIFDLDAWLVDRRNGTGGKPPGTQSPPRSTRDPSYDSDYTAGETLTDAVEGLRRAASSRQRRRL
ncbi:Hypothetical protein, putative [Bodo saltans]|uniref:Uncharacterized protein n=1 Tax=Bodo saltans TaxID=75058 RepID=A0A0S4IRD1_BODSA|nr:Hypothetical protein, putative [Bodo saltans]|eukprot:CUG01606.1 Hypothetical protein, putative [Bodo saltans]